MPGIDGVEAIAGGSKQIDPGINVILMTAYAGDDLSWKE